MVVFPTFFLGNISQENVFYDILERKNAFLGYKSKNFKKSKNCIVPKGLTHGFGPIMAIMVPLLPKKKGRKMAIFKPQPWVNPFRKMSIFRLFKLLVFID